MGLPLMMDFLKQNASAVFGILGALGGAGLTSFAAWFLRKRDYDLRLWEKLLDRRIRAHEQLIKVALEMRVMVALGGTDAGGGAARAPQVMMSKQIFDDWFGRAVEAALGGSTWLSVRGKREANLLQDYLVTLYTNLEKVPSEGYLAVGEIIRQDFIDLSGCLEEAAFSFFEKDVRRLRLGKLSEWHKYPLEETRRRLLATHLLTRWEEIRKLTDSGLGETSIPDDVP